MGRLGGHKIRRESGRSPGEPLGEEDWARFWGMQDTRTARALHRLWAKVPGHHRCQLCAAPFEGPGRVIARPLGYQPSRKNPNICAVCVELSPPGGMQMEAGVLFADLRGFTSRSEGADPHEISTLLRRFYGCAERTLFPEAIIDKLIGDEVMALYLPPITDLFAAESVPALMLAHARELLTAVGYGTPEGPFVAVGVGMDFGEAYVGNIGDRAVYDFTAIGDVVNTASRLQGQAAGGEIVLSERLATKLDAPPGERVELELKGKSGPQRAYRVAAPAPYVGTGA